AVNSETISLTAGSATASSANAATYAGTTITGATISVTGGNALASNYTVPTTGSLTINPALLTITGTKSYTGTTGFVTGQLSVTGAVNSETVSLTAGTGASSSANAGTYAGSTITGATISVTGGNALASNYTVPTTGSLSITAALLTITGTKSYTGTTGFTTGQLSVTGGVNGETIALTAGTGTSSSANAATYAGSTITGATVSVTGGNALASNYSVPTTGSLTISPALLTITGTKTYDGSTGFTTGQLSVTGGVNGETIALTAGTGTSSSANAATYAGSTITGATVSVTGGNALASNYTVPTTGSLTIDKRTLTVALTGTVSKTYDGNDGVSNLTTANYTLGNFASGEGSGSTVTKTTGTYNNANAGTGKQVSVTLAGGDFTLSGANLANYNLPTGTVVGNIGTINPKALTAVLVGSITKVYDANTSATVGSANYSLSGFIGGDGATVSKTAATYDTANVGTGKTVTVSGLVSGEFTATGGALLSNYTLPTSATGAIGAITQKALTVAADNKSKTFGQTDPALTYTATGFVGGDTVALMTGALTRVTGENAGTYAINQGTLTAGGNYAITFTPGVFTINPAGVTLTYSIGNTTNVYGSLPTVGAVTLTGVQGADVVNPVVTVTNASNQAVTLATTTGVGTYTARVTSLTGANAGNYTITNSGSTAGTITVTPATLTVIADNKTKVFGQTDPALTFTGSGLKNSDTLASVLTGGLTRVAGENAGTYAINQGTLAANANYTVAFTPGVFTINPAGLLINFAVANTTNVYGTLPTVGAVTLTGVQGSDVVNPVISITNGANQPITLATNTGVGTYTATVTGLTGANAGNYSLSISGNTPGTITVTPATLTLTAASHIKTYGDDDPALTFTAAGFVAGDAPSLLTGGLGRQSGENVGVYGINSGTVAAGPNYVVRLAGTPTLTIEPAVLTL
ncbi:MBG domain-containing protein, partial [Bradyrhizobium sp.]|uniref:beta strand repeat-containing protein n=1 Tax=Bradyrhizobium sp. TaxID=376 RepID=UPI0025C39FCE